MSKSEVNYADVLCISACHSLQDVHIMMRLLPTHSVISRVSNYMHRVCSI